MEDLNVMIAKNKDNVAMIVVIIVSLLISKGIYDVQMRQYQKVKEDIRKEQEKTTTLDRLVTIDENLKKFKKKGWTTTDFNTIVEKMSALADESGIKMQDISPQTKEENSTYISIPFSVALETEYKKLYTFIKKIERFPVLLHIRTISLESPDSAEGTAPGEAKLIKINMVLEALYLK